MANEVTTSSPTTVQATSRLGMLTAFIAGAFAAWILITVNIEQQRAADEEAMAASSVMAPRPVAPVKPVKPAKPAAGVTVHPAAPKPAAKPTTTTP